jgi:bacillithiol system protein YtxJ
MTWNNLTSENALKEILERSKEQPVVIFKHSTRCSISSTALNRLERSWKQDEMVKVQPYYLDLISYRPVSNMVAEVFDIPHESPQLLIIHNGKCVYDTSHMAISYNDLKERLKPLVN